MSFCIALMRERSTRTCSFLFWYSMSPVFSSILSLMVMPLFKMRLVWNSVLSCSRMRRVFCRRLEIFLL